MKITHELIDKASAAACEAFWSGDAGRIDWHSVVCAVLKVARDHEGSREQELLRNFRRVAHAAYRIYRSAKRNSSDTYEILNSDHHDLGMALVYLAELGEPRASAPIPAVERAIKEGGVE